MVASTRVARLADVPVTAVPALRALHGTPVLARELVPVCNVLGRIGIGKLDSMWTNIRHLPWFPVHLSNALVDHVDHACGLLQTRVDERQRALGLPVTDRIERTLELVRSPGANVCALATTATTAADAKDSFSRCVPRAQLLANSTEELRVATETLSETCWIGKT